MTITLLSIYTLLSIGTAAGAIYGAYMAYKNHPASFDSDKGQKQMFGFFLACACTVMLMLFSTTAWAFWSVVSHAA